MQEESDVTAETAAVLARLASVPLLLDRFSAPDSRPGVVSRARR